MSTITLPIPPYAKISVGTGDRITNKTTLAKISETHSSETIHLAKLLSVGSGKISKYLKKKIGEKIAAGEVIAEKKGLFSSSVVKSPINGTLTELDLSKGTVGLVRHSKEGKKDLLSPVAGKVTAVGRDSLEIEISNPVFKAVTGEGTEVVANLKYLKGDEVGVLETHDNIEESVVLCKFAGSATLVKFSVLDVKGVVMLKIKGDAVLPWIAVEENVFEKLIHFDKKKIWLRPAEKEIIILE